MQTSFRLYRRAGAEARKNDLLMYNQSNQNY
jgi:hypothetical protein